MKKLRFQSACTNLCVTFCSLEIFKDNSFEQFCINYVKKKKKKKKNRKTKKSPNQKQNNQNFFEFDFCVTCVLKRKG